MLGTPWHSSGMLRTRGGTGRPVRICAFVLPAAGDGDAVGPPPRIMPLLRAAGATRSTRSRLDPVVERGAAARGPESPTADRRTGRSPGRTGRASRRRAGPRPSPAAGEEGATGPGPRSRPAGRRGRACRAAAALEDPARARSASRVDRRREPARARKGRGSGRPAGPRRRTGRP